MKRLIVSLLCLMILSSMAFVSKSAIASPDVAPGWGDITPATYGYNLTGADARLNVTGDKRITNWNIADAAHGPNGYQQIDDLYYYHPATPSPPGDWETTSTYVSNIMIGWTYCEFYLSDLSANLGTGYYELLIIADRCGGTVPIPTGWYFGLNIPGVGFQAWSGNETTNDQGAWTYSFFNFPNNPQTGLNWTRAEINALTIVVITYRPDGSGTTFPAKLTELCVMVRDVTPSTPPTGILILRPDGDQVIDNVIAQPTTTDFYTLVDETTDGSDFETTYIVSSNVTSWAVFTLDDVLGRDPNETYTVHVWMIARTTKMPQPGSIPYIKFGLAGVTSYWQARVTVGLVGVWYNYSFAVTVNPLTLKPFTLQEINDMWFSISITNVAHTYYDVLITQCGVLLELSGATYIPPAIEPTMDDMIGWLGQGHGILTIIGIVGFIGMIGIPVAAVVAYKDGGELFITVGNAFWLMVVFFGLFMVGLIGS